VTSYGYFLAILFFAGIRRMNGHLTSGDADEVKFRGGRDALGPGSRYSLLATVEAIINLGTLKRNDTSAPPMSDLVRGGIP
jgi:hypothetical protein